MHFVFTIFVLILFSLGISCMLSHFFPGIHKSLVGDNLFKICIGVSTFLFVADITGRSILLHRLAAIGFGVLVQQASVRTLRLDQTKSITSSSSSECHSIIQARIIPGTEEANRLTPHAARACPNQRLKEFFGVDNCFTSTDSTLCRAFRGGVEELLYVPEGRWAHFASAAKAVASRELEGKHDVSLFGFVQMVSLKTMLIVLFKRDPEETDKDADIRKLAHEINVQWLRSKSDPDFPNHPAWSEPGFALHDAMMSVFPNWDVNDTGENPLNLILPGYETMWRVVLRCFIEVTSRDHPDNAHFQTTLRRFASNPTLEELALEPSHVGNGRNITSPSAMHIAQEALRLYPPTRRVYRDFVDSNGNKIRAAADIEALQRDPNGVWGNSSLEFQPKRWLTLGLTAWEVHYLPFGGKTFSCPAKRSTPEIMPFGVAMIALLVGVLLLETKKDWELRAELPEAGGPLDTDREAYGSAKLVKVETENGDGDE